MRLHDLITQLQEVEYQQGGDTVQMGLVSLVCQDAKKRDCEACALNDLYNSAHIYCHTYIGDCDAPDRTDNKDVIFKLKEE